MSSIVIPFWFVLGGCGAEAPSVPEPQETESPQPTTVERLAPRDAAPGVVLVKDTRVGKDTPLPIADGEEVLVLCGDRLWRKPMRWTRDDLSFRPVNPCSDEPAAAWLAGVSMRVGSGSISPGTGPSELPPDSQMPVSMGYIDGELHTSNTELSWVNEAGESHRLAALNAGQTSLLHWVGDLDNDNVPDFIVDTPEPDGRSHLRLFLSAAASDAQPEEVAAWTAPQTEPPPETP